MTDSISSKGRCEHECYFQFVHTICICAKCGDKMPNPKWHTSQSSGAPATMFDARLGGHVPSDDLAPQSTEASAGTNSANSRTCSEDMGKDGKAAPSVVPESVSGPDELLKKHFPELFAQYPDYLPKTKSAMAISAWHSGLQHNQHRILKFAGEYACGRHLGRAIRSANHYRDGGS